MVPRERESLKMKRTLLRASGTEGEDRFIIIRSLRDLETRTVSGSGLLVIAQYLKISFLLYSAGSKDLSSEIELIAAH